MYLVKENTKSRWETLDMAMKKKTSKKKLKFF